MNAADIAGALRQQITSARFAQHDRLPPERTLAEQFGVARGTVREALKRLEEASFVERRPGSGTYVTYSERGETRSIAAPARCAPLRMSARAPPSFASRIAPSHAPSRPFHASPPTCSAMSFRTVVPSSRAAWAPLSLPVPSATPP